MRLIIDLVPLLLGGLLAWTGAAKAFSRTLRRQAADSALLKLVGELERTVLAFRTLGIAELVLAAALLLVPTWWVPAAGVTLLGSGFVGYLAYGRAKAPKSSCGCTAGPAPISWRAFARAGLVVAGGAAAFAVTGPWWQQVAGRPLGALAVVVVAVLVVGALSTDLDRLWLLPLRQLRIRLFGTPLSQGSAGNPVAASVELLERSLAWESAGPIVRSGLMEWWDEAGWRILRYTGRYGEDAEARQVSVLFALDPQASVSTTTAPAIRVVIVDDATQEILPALQAA
ncbi:MauE/DoxX family redox-associated membrane protein [Flindersiella endophytica]